MRINLSILFFVILVIWQAIDELLTWLGTEMHWLQILAPLVVIGSLTQLFQKQLASWPRPLKIVAGMPLAFCIAVFFWGVSLEMPVERWLPWHLWEFLTAASLMIFPLIAFNWSLAMYLRTGKGSPEREAAEPILRPQHPPAPREPFGTAGKASDDKLRRLGMI